MCVSFRAPLRLIGAARRVESLPFSNITNTRRVPTIVIADVHQFQELIAGRPYLIEVALVAQNRWRAYIVRVPGVPTALMPFYGATPAEAAQLLCQWLTRAHQRAASPPAGSV